MAQVDSENSTAMPARPAGGLSPAGLARQQRERVKALKRLAKLREKAADEIDRLLAFLDACDPYVATEQEDAIDDEACDDNELDGPEHGEDEESESAEPSLGAVGGLNQERWASGNRQDLEGEHDGTEPSEDDEPALGWSAALDQLQNHAGSMRSDEHEPSLGSTATMNQEAWAFGMSGDREQGTTRNFARKPPAAPPSHCNVTWPDGSAFDPAKIRANVVEIVD